MVKLLALVSDTFLVLFRWRFWTNSHTILPLGMWNNLIFAYTCIFLEDFGLVGFSAINKHYWTKSRSCVYHGGIWGPRTWYYLDFVHAHIWWIKLQECARSKTWRYARMTSWSSKKKIRHLESYQDPILSQDGNGAVWRRGSVPCPGPDPRTSIMAPTLNCLSGQKASPSPTGRGPKSIGDP